MIVYLIKSLLCLLVLFSFYKVFLEAESMHSFKRFFLLGSVVFSIVLPLITFSYTVEYAEDPVMVIPFSEVSENRPGNHNENWHSYLVSIALIIYMIGVLIMGFRFSKNLRSIQRDIKNNQQLKNWNYIYVLLKQKLVPHTFLNYIFLSKGEYENDQISESVIEHEKAHVDQKHSLDILFIESLQVIFWFNPVFIWLKKSVKLNHEFLADQQVVSKKANALEYSNVLLNYSTDFHHNSLSSSISNSLIKKRIIMISKSFSFKRFLSRIGFLLPFLALCIYFFNNDIVAKPVVKSVDAKEEKVLIKEDQDLDVISIRLEKDKIFVNNNQVKLNSFAAHLDKLVEDKSDAKLKEMSFHMRTEKGKEGLLNLLNREFEKTRFSKVTGNSILPPPPPIPDAKVAPPPGAPSPQNAGEVPPPPKAPKMSPRNAPPAPPAPKAESERRWKEEALRSERMEARRRERRKEVIAHRKQLQEKRKEIMEERKQLTEKERKQRREEIEIEHKEMRKEMEEAREKHRRIAEQEGERNIPPPPPPSSPQKVIDEVEAAGGSFYYNGKQISVQRARQIVLSKKNINVNVNNTGDSSSKVEISDN
ncbi:M56 family metallopeptidase [Gramella sp. KN1008]|uniref:M56 family metallopeptidase n=1 Tax=Gramella sp. KN1008 TaxID=2529298 RepID=UPI001038C008|nr:M56 family metallopeptidase [Gramella sp. KN1008]TBW29317.1 hypothetical protein EZJ28_05380 [Gramella sp. KN1008]